MKNESQLKTFSVIYTESLDNEAVVRARTAKEAREKVKEVLDHVTINSVWEIKNEH